jgi:hypothetical protein
VEWTNILSSSKITKEDMNRNPQAVLDVLEFYTGSVLLNKDEDFIQEVRNDFDYMRMDNSRNNEHRISSPSSKRAYSPVSPDVTSSSLPYSSPLHQADNYHIQQFTKVVPVRNSSKVWRFSLFLFTFPDSFF